MERSKRTYYGIRDLAPQWVLIEADSLAEAKSMLHGTYPDSQWFQVKIASKGDIEFVAWVKSEEERIKQEREKPGDTDERGLAPSGPRC